jgi:hypothetical protein
MKLLAAGARLSFLIPLFAMAGVATVNSFGDLFSGLIVGILWSHFSVGAGFFYGAALSLASAVALFTFAIR